MEEDRHTTLSVEGLGDEVLKGVHAAKSYVGLAFLTLLFYYIGFFIVGVICNFIFLSNANESKRIIGRNPSGRGCLLFLLWTHLLIPIILFAILVLTGGLAALYESF